MKPPPLLQSSSQPRIEEASESVVLTILGSRLGIDNTA